MTRFWFLGYLSAIACFSSAVGQGSTDLVQNSASVSVLPAGLSCGSSGVVCPAIDGNPGSAWTVTATAGNVSLTVGFTSGPGIVTGFQLQLPTTMNMAVISSMSVEVTGTGYSWLTYIRASCNDSYVRLRGSALYSCIPFTGNGVYTLSAPSNELSVQSGSGTYLWWQAFTQVQLNVTMSNLQSSVSISELSVYGGSVPKQSCNCHPAGVRNISNPCDITSGICDCRNTTYGFVIPSQCVPYLASQIPYGPLSGGTNLVIGGTVGNPSQFSVTLGNSYTCAVNASIR
jgi:hypothetical protein